MLSYLPTRGEPRAEPLFICISTQEQAFDVEPSHPELWQSCTAHQGGTWLIGQFVYICPPFFDFPAPAPSNPQICPGVQNNQFVQNPNGQYFRSDRGKILTLRMLLYYGLVQNHTVYQTFPELQNDVLRRAPTTTYKDLQSYILFLQRTFILKSSRCLSVKYHWSDLCQSCTMVAKIFLMSNSHLGPIPRLSTQAWSQTSLAVATAPTTRRAVSRYRWITPTHLTRLAYRYKDPPMLSGHHNHTINRSRHSHQINRILSKHTPRTKQIMSPSPLVHLANVPPSIIARHSCHSRPSLFPICIADRPHPSSKAKPLAPSIHPAIQLYKHPQTCVPKRKSNVKQYFIDHT